MRIHARHLIGAVTLTALLVVTLSGSHVSAQALCFNAAVPYAAGVEPVCVFAADLDGDGDLDLAAANTGFGSDNVSILKNNGNGTFAAAVNYAAGSLARSVLAADLDGDGDLDLAVANQGSANVSVLKNNGNGTFAAAVNYAAGAGANSVFAADLDGDGARDLAVANFGGTNVSILKNNGNGTFAAAVNYAAGANPHSVFAADLDGDGALDLAVANYYSANVSVLKNNGNGSFAAAVDYAAGVQPVSVFAADLDGDGALDLAVANHVTANVSVLKNNGNGTFAAAVNYAAGDFPFSVLAADLDGDVHLDLAVANSISNNVSVLKNNGNGTFADAVNYAAGVLPYSVFAADLDGDNDADLAVANRGSANVSVLINCVIPPPPFRVAIDSLEIEPAGGGTQVVPPDSIPPVEFGAKLRFYGRVLDSFGAVIPHATMEVFDGISYAHTLSDSGLYRDSCNSTGAFMYEAAQVPEPLSTGEFFPFWFASGQAATPILVPFAGQCSEPSCLVDSLSRIMSELGESPESTVVGLVTDPAVAKQYPNYLPDPQDISNPNNDPFFAGFAQFYSGITNRGFLTGSESSWLDRGLKKVGESTDSLASVLHDLTASKGYVEGIFFVREGATWRRLTPDELRRWDWGKVDWLGVGIGVAVCGLGIATGVAAAPACWGLVVTVAAEISKQTLVPLYCDELVKAREPEKCREMASVAVDGIATVLTIGNSAAKMPQWISYYQQSKNVLKQAQWALRIIQAVKRPAMYLWNYERVTGKYFPRGGGGLFKKDGLVISSVAIDSALLVDGAAGGLQEIPIEVAATTVLGTEFGISQVFDNVADPTAVIISASPLRRVTAPGTTDPASPGLSIHSGTTTRDFTWDVVDHDLMSYTVTIPLSQLPEYQQGLPYRAEVKAEGYDIFTNYSSRSEATGFGLLSTSGLDLRAPNGIGVLFAQGSVSEPLFITLTTQGVKACDGCNQRRAPSASEVFLSANALVIQPDTVTLSAKADVTLQIDSALTERYLSTGCAIFVGRKPLSGATWEIIPSTLDTANLMLTAATNRLGMFAAFVRAPQAYTFCDLNLEGNINPVDVVLIVNYVYKQRDERFQIPGCAANNGDWNCDTAVNPVDVVKYVNFVYKASGDGPCDPCQ